jgi:hypothetical protein
MSLSRNKLALRPATATPSYFLYPEGKVPGPMLKMKERDGFTF